jgi:hypothetical protein
MYFYEAEYENRCGKQCNRSSSDEKAGENMVRMSLACVSL